MDADQFATAMGKAVKARRLKLGLSQRELGERMRGKGGRIRVSARQIYRIEQASRLEWAAHLWRLADALGLNLSTLVREAEGNERSHGDVNA